MYYLLSFIPVLTMFMVGFLNTFNFLPLEYLEKNYYDLWKVILVIILYFIPLIVPMYLTVLHVFFTKFSKKYRIKRWISIIMISAIPLLSVLINYMFLTNPDGFTLAIYETMVFFAILIGYSGIGIFELVYWTIKRKNRKSNE